MSETKNKKKYNNVWQSMRNRDVDSVKEALKDNPDVINKKNWNHRTPLMTACWNKFWDIAKVLLESSPNIDINATDFHGWSVLTIVCICRGDDDDEFFLQLLKHPKLDIDHISKKGWSGLRYAVHNDKYRCIKILLAHGAFCPDNWRTLWEYERGNESTRILKNRRSYLPEWTLYK